MIGLDLKMMHPSQKNGTVTCVTILRYSLENKEISFVQFQIRVGTIVEDMDWEQREEVIEQYIHVDAFHTKYIWFRM
jgi:hypothetical protein